MKAKEAQMVVPKNEADVLAQIEETVKAKYGIKIREMEDGIREMEKEHEYELLKTSADTKVKGAAMRESLERLLRVMFLRQTKERLKPSGLWSRWCEETGVDLKNADREIDKLGDFRDELLLNFGSHVGYEINKIKYLTSGDMGGDSRNSGVVVEKGQVYLNGDLISLTPEDVQLVVEKLQENTRRIEEKAAEEKAALEKEQTETKKALKKAERELKKIKGEAEKKGVTPEEIALIEDMDGVRKDFDAIMERVNSAQNQAGSGEITDRMIAAVTATLEYMRVQLSAVIKIRN